MLIFYANFFQKFTLLTKFSKKFNFEKSVRVDELNISITLLPVYARTVWVASLVGSKSVGSLLGTCKTFPNY